MTVYPAKVQGVTMLAQPAPLEFAVCCCKIGLYALDPNSECSEMHLLHLNAHFP